MMPTLAGDPLRKVTLNLYEADVIILEQTYGLGWSTHVRDLVRDHAYNLRRPSIRRLGDLASD